MKVFFNAENVCEPKPLNFGNVKSNITVNSRYYMIDGKPKLFVAGEFHFERYPREFWEEEILKLKAGGIDVISAYIVWLFHEEKLGRFNFSNDFDDGYFFSLCKKHSMRVIMRIGPYCHGELRHGGLPDFIFAWPFNRSDNKLYLRFVERYWKKLYENTKEYYDGKTVIGIQLENEYVKGFQHLLTLRELAQKVGFRVPIFTVTGWGFSFESNELQGTYGGYAARPWAQHKHQMPVQGNFTIREGFGLSEIGDDIIDYSKVKKPKAEQNQPNMTCECGSGNQVTEHRREIISTNDAFGVPFATVANGVNWLGYYMYHGSSNPRGSLYQESRITFSPNNLPVIDYDFQAPLGRFGYPKQSFKRLKCLNYCLQHFGDLIAPMQPFYSKQLKITDNADAVTPRINVRVDNNSRGFLFATTYEREMQMPPLDDVFVTVKAKEKEIKLPPFSISPNQFLMYPFGFPVGSKVFDYIVAMPVAKRTSDGKTTYYFVQTAELEPLYKSGEESGVFKISESYLLKHNYIDEDTSVVIMTQSLADDFYILGNRVVFTNAVVYEKNGMVVEYKDGDYCIIDGEKKTLEVNKDAVLHFELQKSHPFKAKYKRYLFSYGKNSHYNISAKNMNFSENVSDYLVELGFSGSALQMYSGGILINDYYNYNGTLELSLKYFKDEFNNSKPVKVVAAPFKKMHKIYTEMDFPYNDAFLSVKNVIPYFKKKF